MRTSAAHGALTDQKFVKLALVSEPSLAAASPTHQTVTKRIFAALAVAAAPFAVAAAISAAGAGDDVQQPAIAAPGAPVAATPVATKVAQSKALLPAEGSAQYFTSLATNYADAMLRSGYDTYGTVTPLFASQLDRQRLAPVGSRWRYNLGSVGVRLADRAWYGSNPMHDQQLYQLLYALSIDTGQAAYSGHANEALTWFFRNARNPTTGFFAWGEHMSWDIVNDRPNTTLAEGRPPIHEFFEDWELWPVTYRYARDAHLKFARGLWEHQVDNKTLGLFSRHSRFDQHDSTTGDEFPRHGGFLVRTWAEAYGLSLPVSRTVLLDAITSIVASYERRRRPNGAIPFGSNTKKRYDRFWVTDSNLSQAISFEKAAAALPATLASQLRTYGAKSDRLITTMAHDLTPGGKGFIQYAFADTLAVGDPRLIRLEDREATKTYIYPTGDGVDEGWLSSNGAEKWRNVGEPMPHWDDGAGYVSKAGTNAAQGFTFAAPDLAGRVPSKVTLIVRGTRVNPTSLYLRLKIGGVHYDSANFSLNGIYKNYGVEWTTNPATGEPWTAASIASIEEIGFRNAGTTAGEEARITALHMVISYEDEYYSYMWKGGYGVLTTAAIGNLAYERGRQTNNAAYSAMVVRTAGMYLASDPDTDEPVQPGAVASAIDLMLNAYAISGNRVYLERARHFGRLAVTLFLGDGRPLPKVTSQHDWYETITGGDNLMLSFYRLGKALR